MRTLVVYDTKHGTTREIASVLVKALGEGAEAFELGSKGRADIGRFDAVALGGPVYAGNWSKRAAAFARENADALAKTRFAAFSSGFSIGPGPALLKSALPAKLSGSALALSDFGGAYVMGRMGAFERFIIKAVTKKSSDASSVDEKAILEFAAKLKGGRK